MLFLTNPWLNCFFLNCLFCKEILQFWGFIRIQDVVFRFCFQLPNVDPWIIQRRVVRLKLIKTFLKLRIWEHSCWNRNIWMDWAGRRIFQNFGTFKTLIGKAVLALLGVFHALNRFYAFEWQNWQIWLFPLQIFFLNFQFIHFSLHFFVFFF